MPQIGTNESDAASYFNNTDPVIYALDGDDFIRFDGGPGVHAYIEGGRGDDTIYTGVGSDTVYGGGGDDFIDGGSGPFVRPIGISGDHLYGGDGNDTIYGGGGGDFIYGENGDDIIHGSDDFYTSYLDGGIGNDVIFGGRGHGTIVLGGEGNDVIYGMDAGFLFGGNGSDIYEVTRVGQMVFETEAIEFDRLTGNDNVYAYVDFTLPDHVENLIMIYGAQTYGYGNDEANIIVGNARGNVIEGRGGYDTLIGGAGSDLFLVNPNWGVDVITDFNAGAGTQDAVVFSRSLFSTYAEVMANARQVGTDTWIESGPGNVVVLQNVALGSLHQDDFGFV